jgi:hypothetical protein
LSLRANSFSQSLIGITAPVGLPGEQTNNSWVLAHTSAGTLCQLTLKFNAGSLGA